MDLPITSGIPPEQKYIDLTVKTAPTKIIDRGTIAGVTNIRNLITPEGI